MSADLTPALAKRQAATLRDQIKFAGLRSPPRDMLSFDDLPMEGAEGAEGAESAEEVVSARVATTPADPAERVRAFVQSLDAVEGELYHLLTPEERRRVRLATCPPHGAAERAVQSDPMTSVLGCAAAAACAGALAALLLAPDHHHAAPSGFRGPSSTGARAVERLVSYVNGPR